jgi:hypothetical protein
MRRRFALAVAAIAFQGFCVTTAARAASSIPCDSFIKNADGSWTVLETTYIEGPNVKVREGAVLQPGFLILGADIAAMLDKACPNAPAAPANAPVTAPPGTASGTAAAAQQSRSTLAKYADANGHIEVGQLTCGNLADASGYEADLLLAWYSGRYNGQAKERGVNLAQVRYAIRNVADYCRANPGKNLLQVMELMLK